jgi:hypothetical protein
MSRSTDLPYTIPEMATTTSRTIATTYETSTESEDDPFEQSTVGDSDTESTSPSTIVDAGVVEVTSDAGVVVVTSDTGVVAVTSGGVTSDAGVVVVTSDADVVGVPSDAGVVGVTAKWQLPRQEQLPLHMKHPPKVRMIHLNNLL